MALTYTFIASVTVTGSTTTQLVFNSIPQTYTDLVLLTSTRPQSGSADLAVYLNGVTSGYSARRLLGTGSAVVTDTQAPSQLREEAPTYTASTFTNGQLYIPNYTGSTLKSHSGDSVSENNATQAIQMMTANINGSTSAITSIVIENYTAGNYFAVNSTAYLYGIKSA